MRDPQVLLLAAVVPAVFLLQKLAPGKTRRMPRRFVLVDRNQGFKLRAAIKSVKLACSETEVLCHQSGVLAVLCRTEKEKTAATIAAVDELAVQFEKKLEQMDADLLTYRSVRTRAPRTALAACAAG